MAVPLSATCLLGLSLSVCASSPRAVEFSRAPESAGKPAPERIISVPGSLGSSVISPPLAAAPEALPVLSAAEASHVEFKAKIPAPKQAAAPTELFDGSTPSSRPDIAVSEPEAAPQGPKRQIGARLPGILEGLRRRAAQTALALTLGLAACQSPAPFIAPGPLPANRDAAKFMRLADFDQWRLVANRKLPFKTYHTQGMKKIGDRIFLSGMAEDSAHLLVFDTASLALIRDIELARGRRLNHPGGMDFDGQKLWIPVARDGPGGQSLILTVDPKTLKVETVGAFPDHLGCLLCDGKTLRGPNWTIDWYAPPSLVRFTPKDLIEYQDCKSLGECYALGGGREGLIQIDGVLDLLQFDKAGKFRVLRRMVMPHVERDGAEGGSRPLTHNPMDYEVLPGGKGIRFYFAPHDGHDPKSGEATHLFIFDAPLSGTP